MRDDEKGGYTRRAAAFFINRMTMIEEAVATLPGLSDTLVRQVEGRLFVAL